MATERTTPEKVKKRKPSVAQLRTRWAELRAEAGIHSSILKIRAGGLGSTAETGGVFATDNIAATRQTLVTVHSATHAATALETLAPVAQEMAKIHSKYEAYKKPLLKLRELSESQWAEEKDPESLRELELKRRKVVDYYAKNFDAYQWIKAEEPDLVDPYIFRGALTPEETVKLFETSTFLEDDRISEMALAGDYKAILLYGAKKKNFYPERRLEILGYDYKSVVKELYGELDAVAARKQVQTDRIADRRERSEDDPRSGPSDPIAASGDLANTAARIVQGDIKRQRNKYIEYNGLLGGQPNPVAIRAEVAAKPNRVLLQNIVDNVGGEGFMEVGEFLSVGVVNLFEDPTKVPIQKIKTGK